MGPLGVIITVFGIMIHIICGLLNARIWWEDWQEAFIHTSDKAYLIPVVFMSLILGLFAILGRLFAWYIAPKIYDLFQKIPNLRKYLK